MTDYPLNPDFEKHLACASREVENWPMWKQDVLGTRIGNLIREGKKERLDEEKHIQDYSPI
ncbi:MAG: hypothetical protein PHF86_05540 [Candidatus Nanoarchaeia archaeon]|nr:hypothetical protein [Candidatus Nanoarchaeia archaeon]